MDWDWEDRPPRDTPPPRRADDEPDDERDLAQSGPAEPRSPLESAARRPELERPEDESPFEEPPPLDSAPEYVMPERSDGPGGGAPLRPEFELPRMGTIEAAERAAVTGAGRPDDGRRPRSSQDRAAAREQRSRQLRRRRLIALAVVVAIVALLVVLVIRGCGGSDAAAAAFAVLVLDRRFLAAPERE